MTIHWLLLPASSLPDGDDWLGSDEWEVFDELKFPKRRSEWRLGRFVAKRALATFMDIDDPARIQIIAAKDGAPEAFIDGRKIDSSISISHRQDVAACAIASEARVGCDLEAIEPRTSRFVEDFFTDRERAALGRTPDEQRDRHVALTWSAKESALKALRVGLRRDTRSVEVGIEDPEAIATAWHALNVTSRPENRRFRGWWRCETDLVLTLVCDDSVASGPSDQLNIARNRFFHRSTR